MPNHVTNILKFWGDRLKISEMTENIKNDNFVFPSIDFNKLIPMPEELNITSGSNTNRGLEAYKNFIEVYTLAGTREDADLLNIPEESEKAFLDLRTDIDHNDWELGKKAFQNELKYGAPTWYEWCVGNWGTKWNAYDFEESGNAKDTIKFDTAWSAPHPVIAKLAEMYLDIEIEHEWADEDIGYNCGKYVYRNGERIEEYFPESRVDCIDFALKVKGLDPTDYGMHLNAKGDDYIYIDDEEYEPIEFFGKPALFTEERKTDADIPNGLHCYQLRSSDDGSNPYATVEKIVSVNFSGSVITSDPIDLGENGYVELGEENTPNFIGGDDITLDKYIEIVGNGLDFSDQNDGMGDIE